PATRSCRRRSTTGSRSGRSAGNSRFRRAGFRSAGRGGPAPLEPDCVLEKRRVVITGLGAVTPLGNSTESFWEGLVTGRSGVGPTQAFDASKLTTRIAAEIKDFDPDALIGRREARRMDRYAQFAVVAAREAIADS